jgi:NADP-dependent 3-hydroxy acid dehydrogenase YdfG
MARRATSSSGWPTGRGRPAAERQPAPPAAVTTPRAGPAEPAGRPLDGWTAVVTGASRGIGRATVAALLGAGARVVGLSRSGAASRGAGVAVVCDLADAGGVARALDAVAREFGGAPDILVNNAGAFVAAPVDQTPVSTFAHLVALNLGVPFQLAHAWLPAMRARGRGHVVSVGSIADHVAMPGNAAYAASKFGLRGLHEVLRAELTGTGVRATLVSPAAVDTPLWGRLEPVARATFPAAGDMLAADDVAGAILYAVTRPAGTCIDEIRLSRS